MKNYTILLVDDEISQREPIKGFLQKQGYNVLDAGNYLDAISIFKKNDIDLVITDYRLTDKTGFDVLEETKKQNPNIPVVIMTAYGSIEDAVKIMKTGAYDYLQKPIELSELLHIIEKCYERSYLISENLLLKQQLENQHKFSSIISQSDEMEAVLNIAGRVANSKASVLICGESGTGKELIAKAIHYSSPRKDKPFVVVNCAAMPETLFESELFGHEKGAFTGAEKMRIGKFEQADTGTLFIDEVGDIPMLIQVKLLRAIQFSEIQRVGSNKTMELDVRIIAATNRNLNEMIKNNEFREDLFYRLNVVAIQIPSLRSRKIDVQPLIEHFIDKYAKLNLKDVISITKEALNILTKYDFPGNIRELENIIQRAVVLTRNNYISVEDLPNIIKNNSFNINKEDLLDLQLGDLNLKVEELEKTLIEKALNKASHNQVKAAELLYISERTLRYKISKYGLK